MHGRPNYLILGMLILLQQVIALFLWSKKLITSTPKKLHYYEDDDEKVTKTATTDEDDSKFRCTLCLERRVKTTVTPCGHLYCWNCIHEWCINQSKCPNCRAPITLQGLARAYHYDTPQV